MKGGPLPSNTSPRRVAGVDASLTKTGVARTDGTLCTIKLRSNLKGYERLFPMARAIDAELAGPLELVVLEGYSMHAPGALALIRAAELGGLLRSRLSTHGMPFVDVPPSTLKKYATGKGNAKKEAMLAYALEAGAHATNDDEADAYWLRQIGLELLEPTCRTSLEPIRADILARHPSLAV